MAEGRKERAWGVGSGRKRRGYYLIKKGTPKVHQSGCECFALYAGGTPEPADAIEGFIAPVAPTVRSGCCIPSAVAPAADACIAANCMGAPTPACIDIALRWYAAGICMNAGYGTGMLTAGYAGKKYGIVCAGTAMCGPGSGAAACGACGYPDGGALKCECE